MVHFPGQQSSGEKLSIRAVKAETGALKVEKLMNNTFKVYYPDGQRTAIRYHHTDIINLFADGSANVTTGGWLTSTTKERLNNYLPHGWRIHSDRGVWYITRITEEGQKTHVYQDGVIIHADGTLEGDGGDPKEKTKVKRMITKYVNGFVESLLQKKIRIPGPGDCFYCHLRDVASGLPMGEAFKGNDHIMEHMKEGYYVPSLLFRAIEVFSVSIIAKAQIAWLTGMDGASDYGNIGEDLMKSQVRSSLRRYVNGQLGLAA